MIKIFILEDDIKRLEWFKNIFNDANIHIATEIDDACDKLKKEKYDLIFLDRDLGNPNQNGEDVAWEMYQDKIAQQTPVIIHSMDSRGQRILGKYLNKYKKNVFNIKFTDLRKYSKNNIYKITGLKFDETKDVKENQTSMLDFLIDNLSSMHGKNSRREKAAQSLYKIWQSKQNKIHNNVYRKPLSVDLKDVDDMEEEGFIHRIGDNIAITQKGSSILKVMILGDNRCAFGKNDNESVDLKSAEESANKKKSSKVSHSCHEKSWWNNIIK